jgi:spermidine synthase
VIDIDPAIVQLAREYFGFSSLGDVIIADARHFIATTRRTYDYVILDVFTGDTTPAHLLSLEAMRLLKRRINANGILAINIVGSLKRNTFITASVIRTLQAVFEQVDIYPTFDPDEHNGTGNLAVMAYSGPPRNADARILGRFAVHPLARHVSADKLTQRFRFPLETHAIILTDNYNPIDVFDAWLKESAREEILDTTDWDVLITSG